METFSINLRDLRFYSKIGVLEQERIVGNEFSVSVSITYDASGFVEERLESTISYAEVYDVVRDEMQMESLLLESVVKRISERISRQWGKATAIRVSICKHRAPISGLAGDCGIEYFWKKS